MAKLHEIYIQNYLSEHTSESFISTELIAILLQQFPTLTANNCRKIINNALGHNMISSSAPITFANNQYAYFSTESPTGYEVLANSIKKHKQSLHRVIFALERNGGILTYRDAFKISGATLADASHSISFKSIINELKQLKIADIQTIHNTKFVVQKKKSIDISVLENLYNDQKNTNLLLFLSLNWLVHSNLIDSKQLCYMGESNDYSGIERNDELWDAFGFSNATGIRSSKKEFQTIVLIDFLPNHTYEEYDFIGFKERVDRTIFSTTGEHRKVLPIIFSCSISPSASSLIKKYGYLCFNIFSLLGENALNIARNYTQNIASIEQKISSKSTDFGEEISNSLKDIRESGNETNYGNLKGQLFEYLMYPVIQKIYGANSIITHNYSGSIDGQKFECDYLVELNDENIIIELKGYKKGNIILKGSYDQETQKYTPNSILWFLNQTFNLCSRKLGNRRPNKFCYITTAELEDSAKAELTARKKNKPTSLECFYNYTTLIKLLQDYDMKNEIKVIKQFYV
jgi:hypothetical protein